MGREPPSFRRVGRVSRVGGMGREPPSFRRVGRIGKIIMGRIGLPIPPIMPKLPKKPIPRKLQAPAPGDYQR